jgi:hypothetical protein
MYATFYFSYFHSPCLVSTLPPSLLIVPIFTCLTFSLLPSHFLPLLPLRVLISLLSLTDSLFSPFISSTSHLFPSPSHPSPPPPPRQCSPLVVALLSLFLFPPTHPLKSPFSDGYQKVHSLVIDGKRFTLNICCCVYIYGVPPISTHSWGGSNCIHVYRFRSSSSGATNVFFWEFLGSCNACYTDF